MIEHDELLQCVRYEPETGHFYWIGVRSGRVHSGTKRAGCLHPDGYVKLRFGPKLYRAAHLAVYYMTSVYPKTVDHINRVRHDDRYVNLRPATRSQNQANRGRQANNTSGYKGVTWNKKLGRWQASVCVGRQSEYLGLFDDVEVAGRVAAQARKRLHGEFASD